VLFRSEVAKTGVVKEPLKFVGVRE
jgi:hypothetical protein